MKSFTSWLLIFICVAFTGCDRRSRVRGGNSRKFVTIERLENGGSAYHEGTNWWYYHTRVDDSGNAAYSADANTWVSSARSPADFGLRADSKNSTVEEVEVTESGRPEGGILSEEEVSEMESQVNDMISEGNPNDQDAAVEGDAGNSESDSGGGDSGGSDSGGGDGGGGGGDGGGGD